MFTKKSITVFGVLTALIVVLSAVLTITGPRIRSVDYDANRITEYTDQTIVLRANQPIQSVSKEQINIEPATEFTINTTGEAIIIQLKQRLLYDTQYSIQVNDVQNNKHQKTTYTTSLKTNQFEYYYLTRGDKRGDDKSLDEIIDSKTKKSIVSQPYIFDYDVIGSHIVYISGENRDNVLAVYDPKSKQTTDIALPTQGTVDNLHTSPNNNLIGFTFRSNERGNKAYNDTLFIYDVKAKVLSQPKGVSDKPVTVGNWSFSPDGTSIFAQTFDSGTLIIDTTNKNKPIPLGSFTSLSNLSGDGKRLSAGVSEASQIIDLTTNKKTTTEATERSGIKPYVSSVWMLQNSNRIARSLYLYNADTQYSHTILDIGSGSDFKQLVDLDEQKESLIDYRLTNNDQYVLYESHPVADQQEYDDYNTGSRPISTTTTILDALHGNQLTRIEGINIIAKRFN